MNNIWGESAIAFILAGLAAAGFAAVIFGVCYLWITKTGKKRKMEGSEIITVVFIAFFVGLVATIPLVNQLVNDSKRMHSIEQSLNCSNSRTAEGSDFTERQCEYFQDVLNGKYLAE